MVPSERPQRTSPDFTLAPFSVNNNPPLPPFAPKAVLRPPPVHPATPPPTAQKKRRATSTRSMDVMEAAKQAPWIEHGASTRSLLSTIKEKSAQQPSTFAQRVFEAGKPDLLYELTERKRLKMRSDGVLDLTTLERMNQHVLQQKLVEQVKALGERGAWMEIGVQQTLHDYCKHLSSGALARVTLTKSQASLFATWSTWSNVLCAARRTIRSCCPHPGLWIANS